MPATKAGAPATLAKPSRRGAAALLGLGLLLLAASLLILPPERSSGPWKGWRLLLLPEELEEAEVLEALGAAGLDRVLSESSQALALSAWDGRLETFSLAEAASRLLTEDPRLDDYVRGLPSWFRARGPEGSYRIYYMRSAPAWSLGDPLREAARSLSPEALILGGEPAASTRPSLLSPAAALLAGLGLVLASTRGRLRRAAALLPWLALGAAGKGAGPALAWAGALALLLARADEGFNEYRRSGRLGPLGAGLLHGASSSLILLLPSLGALLLSPRLIPSFLLALLASGALLLSQSLLSRRRALRRDRPPFVALRIEAERPGFRPAGGRVLVGLACCAAALGLALSVGGRFDRARAALPPGLELPLPAAGPGRAFPLPEDAEELARAGEGPPDLADWLLHRARQEALFLDPLGRKEGGAFESVFVPQPGGGFRAALEFSEAWARAAYRSIPALSLEALQRDQGAYHPLRPRGPEPSSPEPLAPFEAILYILFLAFPLYGALSGLPRGERAGSVRKSYESP